MFNSTVEPPPPKKKKRAKEDTRNNIAKDRQNNYTGFYIVLHSHFSRGGGGWLEGKGTLQYLYQI